VAIRTACGAEEQRFAIRRIAGKHRGRILALQEANISEQSLKVVGAQGRKRRHACGGASLPQNFPQFAIRKLNSLRPCGNIWTSFAATAIETVASGAGRFKDLSGIVTGLLR
jgi:hypothetical protein